MKYVLTAMTLAVAVTSASAVLATSIDFPTFYPEFFDGAELVTQADTSNTQTLIIPADTDAQE